MLRKKLILGAALAVSGVTTVVAGAPAVVHAADHLDAPGSLQSPLGRHDADINDIYAFPADGSHTVLAMTTHPALGVVTTQTSYATDVLYKINIASASGDGDFDADDVHSLVVRFEKVRHDGSQRYTVSLDDGEHHRRIARARTGEVGDLKNGAVFAGARSDPFFFDLDAFNNTVQATGGRSFCTAASGETGKGVDFFSALNTNAIVLKVPNSLLFDGQVKIWGSTTSLDGSVQYDRMARPAINTVFNGFKKVFNSGDNEDKNEFNAIKNPQDDPTTDGGKFRKNVITVLEEFSSLSGTPYTDAEAAGLADVLLPDTLPYDVSKGDTTDGVFNGRSLKDDVIDTELNVVTKGAVKTDCVGAHTDYLTSFPYLGEPHPPTP